MTPLRVALALLVVCAVAAWQVTVIPASMMQMTVGASLVPALVVVGLTVLALLYGWSARALARARCLVATVRGRPDADRFRTFARRLGEVDRNIRRDVPLGDWFGPPLARP